MEDEFDGLDLPEDSAWFAAIKAADCWHDQTGTKKKLKKLKKAGDLGRLVELLRAKAVGAQANTVTMTRAECELLIDLLSRHFLKQKAGGRRVPAYKQSSLADFRADVAVEFVRALESKGADREQAIKLAVKNGYASEGTVRARLRGKLHPDR